MLDRVIAALENEGDADGAREVRELVAAYESVAEQPRGDEERLRDAERIARDFLAAVAALAGRLSLKNPGPTPADVEHDADLIVRACRTARDALDGTPLVAFASPTDEGGGP